MRNLPKRIVPLIGTALACCLTIALQAAPPEPDSASDSKPVVTKIPGVLEAVSSREISFEAEQVESLEIAKIVAHGSDVKKGQNVIWFQRDDIDKKIRDAEVALRLSKLTLDGELFQYEHFLESQNLDRQAAQRKRDQAKQDYDNFTDVDRDRQAETAAFNLKSSQASLANAQEELTQLEQMYREDDLTEESEEIVLKRAKQAVESARFRLDSAKIQAERTLSQEIPRAIASQQETWARAEMAYKKSMQDLNLSRQRRDIEMRQKKEKFAEEEKQLAELKQERNRMVLTSPISGIALHGKLNRGKLGDKPSSLQAKSKVTAGQVLLTIVDPKNLQIRVDLDESQLGVVTKGRTCQVVMKAFPELAATGTVKSVSKVPYASNKYDCVVTLKANRDATVLLPTMSCELQFH